MMPSCNDAEGQDTSVVAGTVVVEDADQLMPDERRLLKQLDRKMIPAADTIKLVDSGQNNNRGWVNRMNPSTIHLSPRRRIHADATEPKRPYFMGKDPLVPQDKVRHQTHVLAHEIAHVLAPKLKADVGRPALGLLPTTQETQAEIIGLVLMEIAFGVAPEELGFPSEISYAADAIKDKSTARLRRQYCQIIKTTWRLTGLKCTRH